MATQIDWLEAQKYYLTDATVSLADVAKKFGVSKTAVEQRASNEGWAKLRQKLGADAMQIFKQRLVSEKAKANDRHLDLYQRFQKVAADALDALEQGSWLTDKRGDAVLHPETQEPIKVAPDSFVLQRLSSAIKNAIEGERVVLGLPTSVSVHTDPEGRPLQPVYIYDLRGQNNGSADNSGGAAAQDQQQTSGNTPSGN